MALTTFTKNDTTNALNLSTSWTGGVAPNANTAQMLVNSTVTLARTAAAGASFTLGQIKLVNPGGGFTIGATTSTALTLDTTDAETAGVGIDMSAATQNMTVAQTLTLGTSQTWSVASGRTLAVNGAISSSSKTLTLSGSGTVSLGSIARTGWTGSTTVVQSGVRLSATVNIGSELGASTNTFVVENGGALFIGGEEGPLAIGTSNLTISGEGNALQYGAIYVNNNGGADWNNRYVTVVADNTVISIDRSRTINIAGTVAGDVIYNTVATGDVPAPLVSWPSTITVGGYIRVRAWDIVTRAERGRYLGFNNDGNTFGAATNKVFVENSSGFTPDLGNRGLILTRDYTFEGETTTSAPAAGKAYACLLPLNGEGTITFNAGSLTAAASNRYIKFQAAGPNSEALINFNGATLTGDFGIICFNSLQNLGFLSTSDISTWTGSLQATRVRYQTAPVGAATWNANAIINNILGSALTLQHSSYSVGSFTFTGSSSMSLGSGPVTSTTSPTITVSANTLTIPGNVSVLATLVKNGAGTLALSGNNTIPTGVTLSAGTLVLDSAGSAGPSATTFTFVVGASLDSTTGATLNQNGLINTGALAGSWTWVGTNDLTFGTGNITLGGDRTITHGATGGVGTLKFRGGITTSTATLFWNFGGSRAGAKQRVTLVGANASLVAATAADQHSVTAGYFRIENNNGLGAAGTTTSWWVGATNLGVQTTKAALELAGVTTPDTKSVNLYNIGPNDDGALIGASGTSVFLGGISILNVAGTRFGAKAGATLTLASGFYTVINAANANTPLSFVAETGGQINVDRILGGPTSGGSNIGAVTVTGGSGTVVLSRANLHTGATTCSAGTTKVTHINATSTGSVFVPAGATLESTVQSQFQSTLSLGTTSSLSRAILKFAA
jgi:autotransporter-associated beta strand protein